MPRQIYQLKISLAEVSPPVWRRVLVPGGYTLDRGHRACAVGAVEAYHLVVVVEVAFVVRELETPARTDSQQATETFRTRYPTAQTQERRTPVGGQR